MTELDANWKQVPSFEQYQINKDAQVKSPKGILKPNINHLGVFYYNLTSGKKRKKVNATRLAKELFPSQIIRDKEFDENILKAYEFLNKIKHRFHYINYEEKYYNLDDIIQITIMKIMNNYSTFVNFPHKKTYLHQLMRGNISNAKYKQLTFAEDFQLENLEEPQIEEKQDLTFLIESLNKTETEIYDRKKILKYYLEGFEIKEIAEELCMSYDATKQQLQKIKKFLIKHFKASNVNN
jgi:RNA polymerase sigma factor (sigma-70 family)